MAGHRQSDEHWNCFKSQRWMEERLRDGPVKTIWAFPKSRTNDFDGGKPVDRHLSKKQKQFFLKQDEQNKNNERTRSFQRQRSSV